MAPLIAALLLNTSASMTTDVADWLTGCWAEAPDGVGTVEVWINADNRALLALNYRAGEQLSFEYLRIDLEGETPVYVPQPNGQPPTRFVQHEAAPGYVLFGNDEHDYPQRIGYRRTGDEMEVWLSLADGSRRFGWTWQRIPCSTIFEG